MPEEWRLTFYSSQFNCVFLSNPLWAGKAVAERREWRDEVHSEFVFLLESDDISTHSTALADKEILVDSGDTRICWFDKNSDLRGLADVIRGSADDAELFLLSRDGDLAQMERVNTLLELMGY